MRQTCQRSPFDLMPVENKGDAAWTTTQLHAWLPEAGLTAVDVRRDAGPIAVIPGHGRWRPEPHLELPAC